MQKFIRLQSKKYDVNKNSKSFEWGFADLHDAMNNDVTEYFDNEDFEDIERKAQSYRHYNLYLKYRDLDNELTEDEKNLVLEELWEELFGNKERGYMVLNGISCYTWFEEETQERARNLYEYFQEHDKTKWNDEESYILFFEGQGIGIGHNDENVAIFEKELKKMTITDFMKEYKPDIIEDEE